MNIVNIRQLGRQAVEIEWDDGHNSLHFAGTLRENCPCSLCQEQIKVGNLKLRVVGNDTKNVTIMDVQKVGRYAVSFVFSDQHNTGIYTYEYLRQICECSHCRES